MHTSVITRITPSATPATEEWLVGVMARGNNDPGGRGARDRLREGTADVNSDADGHQTEALSVSPILFERASLAPA